MNRLSVLTVARRTVTASILLWSVSTPMLAKSATSGKSQLAFGVDMAKRGLWSEALFRFEQARKGDPESLSILNNLAICYEAGGRFDEALATYKEALKLKPDNRVLKQNYTRFAEFYQGFRPKKAAPAAAMTVTAVDGSTPGTSVPPADAPAPGGIPLQPVPPAPAPGEPPSPTPPAPPTGSATPPGGGR
ncbi:MAG: tetratricopeptide repeat protein [Thermoanaerobaculia bacterium]